MNCPKCGFENQQDASFCNECGSRLEISCAVCGKGNLPGSKFCKGCGHDLKESGVTSSIDYSQTQSYTPKYLADKILTTRRSIEGERKLVTVLFADVANYTSIAEKLDPEEVHQIMDGCFKILMDEIHRDEGTINQFTGDGVMALFGAPVAHEDHAQRACHASLSIQKAIEGYGEKIKRQHGADFKIRMGLNSGPVVVGSIGDDLRMDYTAVGDTTNLAHRMQDMANPGAVIVSRPTHQLSRDFFEFTSLGKVEVKGKEEPQEAYELIRPTEVETRIEAAVAKGLTRFVGRSKEIEALREAVEKAQSGSGQVIGVLGEAGVGKSRLLLELRVTLPEEEYSFLEGGDVAPEIAGLVLGRAGGNPPFVEELTHNLIENGSIQKKNHQFALVRNPSDIEVPDAIQGIIAARMDRIEDNLKRIMGRLPLSLTTIQGEQGGTSYAERSRQ
jgi:class 3 adenylate cyclase